MKKKQLQPIIILTTIITIIIFFLFFKEHFALDTYLFENGINENIDWYTANGRLIMSLFLKICSILNLSFKTIKTCSLIISLIVLYISNIILNKNIKKYINNNLSSSFITTSIIYSPFIFEFYLFPEFTGVMSFGIFASVIAYIYMTKYFENKKINNLIITIIMSFISVSSYQGVIGCFVALSSFYIMINYKDIKKFITQNIYVVSIYGIVSILSLIITKLCGLTRTTMVGYNLIETIKVVIKGITSLIINTSYVFPKYYFSLMLLLLFILIIFFCIKTNDKKIHH